ncbi:MAG: recombinase family protein [Eubacterium sp.]|jgi:DNA invertase Pin-like site-specific DNA recombinase|nr:recombinase family protein [Eubacterium sp.]
MLDLKITETPFNVAAYCRVSTDKEDQKNSLSNQRQFFTEYISKNPKWNLVDVYFDEGITGTSTNKRKGFHRMITDAREGKIGLILTKETSRFARNTVDTLEFTRELRGYGVGVLFLNDNIYTLDSDGETRLTLMAMIAQEESRKTSDRVKWGQRRQMEKGVVFGTKNSMYGYTVQDGKLSINEDEAEIVRLIFNKYVNEGKGTYIIAKELNKAKIKPKRAKAWSEVIILRILRNEKHCGDLIQRKEYTPDYLNQGKRLNSKPEDMICIRDHHEPIIERNLWERAQEEIKKRSPSQETKSKYSNRYWCSGKLICGKCGKKYVIKTYPTKKGGPQHAWRCHGAAEHGAKKVNAFGEEVGCNSSSINEKVLTTCVEYVLSNVFINKDEILNELTGEINKVVSNSEFIDTSKMVLKMEEICNKKKKAIDLCVQGIIQKPDLVMMNKAYDDEIEDIQQQIVHASEKNAILKSQVNIINDYINEVRNIIEFKQKSEKVLEGFLEKAIIHDDNCLDVYLNKFPFAFRLKHSTTGRGNTFNTVITDISILSGSK